ncbi:YeiH family protein [Luteococcus japonicus]|uniref:Putative membrane protein YeiH n=1 Tax=Luteococcus japonicus LSP_Lj1 TaxID=1255658 RepID=A0A1R4JSL6_9ACTN|nr:putative sulfate exporter family transporter [Luteococcus japonicus]SJN35251.1 Putative membrane protein YeiH [Luteococcus japonicus LSP_Lj1]
MKNLRRLLPGLLLCAAGAVLAVLVNRAVPTMSALLVAILLGVAVTNLVPVPARFQPGVACSAKRLLRIGIVLLGLQLVLGDIARLGAGMGLVIVAVVLFGILGSFALGRALGMARTQCLLISSGFSICGAAAVAGVNSVVDADEDEVATAIALVVLYGTLMIPIVPLLAHLFGLGTLPSGLWAGASIHEVAQVVAAGAALGPAALKVAVVVKLARVLMLAPVVVVMGAWLRRSRPAQPGANRPPIVPLFVAGFVAMVLLASLHVVPAGWLPVIKIVQTVLLAAAMFALGLGVKVSSLVKVGPKPFVLGLLTTVWVAGIALAGVMLVS